MAKGDELSKYFECEEFNQLFEIIREHDQIDQERLLYNVQAIEGLSEEKFSKVFHAVYQRLELDAVRDESCSFPKYHIDYKGIRFHLMIGQGSACWTTKQE